MPSCLRPFDPRLLDRSIFVDPPDPASRLWAIDLALRCGAVSMVVADGSALDMSASRRLQLAAERGGVFALLARPPCERDVLSAASTRWTVERAVSRASGPRWQIGLVRCKGMQRGISVMEAHRWTTEWDRAKSAVHLSSDVVDRRRQTPLENQTRFAG